MNEEPVNGRQTTTPRWEARLAQILRVIRLVGGVMTVVVLLLLLARRISIRPIWFEMAFLVLVWFLCVRGVISIWGGWLYRLLSCQFSSPVAKKVSIGGVGVVGAIVLVVTLSYLPHIDPARFWIAFFPKPPN